MTEEELQYLYLAFLVDLANARQAKECRVSLPHPWAVRSVFVRLWPTLFCCREHAVTKVAEAELALVSKDYVVVTATSVEPTALGRSVTMVADAVMSADEPEAGKPVLLN